jgi:DNA polymerase-1
MRVLAWDLESHLIKPGRLAPRMVCLSWATKDDNGDLHTGLCDRADGLKFARAALEDDGVIMVGHNHLFDLGVIAAEDPTLLPLIFAKLEKGLARDTLTRQRILDIATGESKFFVDEDGNAQPSKYSLAALSYRLNKKFLKKEDTWRLRYAELDGVPISEWPEDASQYAIDDGITTLEVYETQDRLAGVPDKVAEIPDADRQHRAAWALYLMSMWGVRTDGAAVAKLKAELEKDFDEYMEKLRPTGLIKAVRKKGEIHESKSMKTIKDRVEAAFTARGELCPRTDPSVKFPDGQVATDKKTLIATGDPDLKNLAEVGGIGKLLNTYVPALENGTKWPICAKYNVLMDTGRTSCEKPNLQNPPRKGGVRECFIPRPSWVFAFADYDTLELRALAQVCLDVLGKSQMAEALRRGEDLHLSLAAEMLGISLEEAQRRFNAGDAEVKEYRQQSKPANFGFPGGMAAESFKEYAEGYGIFLTSDQCEAIKDSWSKKWTEMDDYFAWIKALSERDEPIQQARSGRLRGGASFCAIANGFFQGLAADGAKEALWAVAKECYLPSVPGQTPSPLFGCRPVLFLHDEIGIEIPYQAFGPERSSAAADRLSTVMVESMKKWIPDIPIGCKPYMVRRWFKGAEAVRQNGVLVPCRPVTSEKDGKKKTVWAADL